MQQNRFQVAGYLAAKPELRYLPSGMKVANARLGETYRYKGKDRQVETHTNWHRLTFYDTLADVALTFNQGDNVFAEGTIQQRQYTPADGSKRTVNEVVVKSCHLIAPSHHRPDTNGVNTASGTEEGPHEENAPTDNVHPNWPL
jgi:single-strand DNA-binding protein